RLRDRGARARRGLRVDGVAALARADAAACGGALPLLAALPGPALRGHGGRRGARLMDEPFQEPVDMTPGLALGANFMGWALFVAALCIFGLTILAAYVYLWAV